MDWTIVERNYTATRDKRAHRQFGSLMRLLHDEQDLLEILILMEKRDWVCASVYALARNQMKTPDDQVVKKDDYDQFVPFTARIMAAKRAIEDERLDAIFKDPFAKKLAGEKALQNVRETLAKDPRNTFYVAVRTRYFDDFLFGCKVSQVVLLASGLDTRAYRHKWAPGMNVYELDLPQVLEHKASALKDDAPQCNHICIPVDLTQDWEDKLLAKGYEADKPSAWLIEGLLMYLEKDEARRMLDIVSRLSTRSSFLAFDVVNSSGLNDPYYKGYFQSGWDHPKQLIEPYGWEASISQPGEEHVSFGRYTIPPAGPSRVFLVTARKTQDGKMELT